MNNKQNPGPTYENDELSEDDIKLLAELDAIDISTAELAVEFTDDDIRNNATLLGQMTQKRGHANNIECESYTYVINVYQRDALNGTYLYTRIYEFANNAAIALIDLFKNANAHFIHRSSTESFAAADEPSVIHIEKRQINVYDLIVPEGFDIDAPHYHYHAAITSFEPWEQLEEHWSTELHDEWVDSIPEHKVLKMHPNSPHQLDTREAFPIFEVK